MLSGKTVIRRKCIGLGLRSVRIGGMYCTGRYDYAWREPGDTGPRAYAEAAVDKGRPRVGDRSCSEDCEAAGSSHIRAGRGPCVGGAHGHEYYGEDCD